MSQGEVKTGAQTDESRKAAMLIAAAGVIGFSAGWGLSLVVNPDLRMFLGVVGLVVGASSGWLIGRLGSKATT